jgi:hypothetical protein
MAYWRSDRWTEPRSVLDFLPRHCQLGRLLQESPTRLSQENSARPEQPAPLRAMDRCWAEQQIREAAALHWPAVHWERSAVHLERSACLDRVQQAAWYSA